MEEKKKNIDFAALIECLPDIVYVIDREGRFTYVSDYIRVLGYRPNELLGRHFSVIIHPDDVHGVSRSFVLPQRRGTVTGDDGAPGLFDERRRSGRITRGMDIRLMPKSTPGEGEEVHGSVFTNAEVNACGNYSLINEVPVFTGTIGIIRDITTRKKNEETVLRRSEERYRSIIQQSRDAIIQVGRDGVITYANPASLEMFLIDRETPSAPYPDFDDFVRSRIHPDYLKQFDQIWRRYRDSGLFPEDSNEWAWRLPDGEIRYTENSFTPVFCEGSGDVGFQIVSRDVTKRRAVEMSLRESEEMFRNLAENSPSMIYINRKGKVVYANAECERVTGYTREELTADTFNPMSLIAPESADAVKGYYMKHLRGEEVSPYEYILLRKGGRKIDVINSTKLIKYSGEDAILGVVTDITDRKLFEENKRKAQRLESLAVLAGGIAHDFNNILTVVMGNITLSMLNPEDKSLVMNNLKAAEEAVGRAKDLTRQFLSFSRTDAPVKRTMLIGDMLRNAVTFSVSGSSIRPNFHISEDISPVEIDEAKITQVFQGLVINAIQAMPEGGSLDIRASNETLHPGDSFPQAGGEYVKISFTDTGHGIPEEDMARIFDPYFTTREMASGLGLAIGYSIIHRHGGFIEASSSPGVGTTFNVYIPASKEAVPGEVRGPSGRAVEGGRVLVMDDDEGILVIVEKFLRYLGYEMQTARDGGEAVEKYFAARDAGSPFSAVILDLTVPGGMGGKDALAAILDRDPDVRAVLSSGYINDPTVIRYNEHGFRDVIAKPYRIDELGRVLHRVLLA